MATVFVGIPTFNRPDFVKDAVRSVLAQEFGDFRVIVSDNASEPEAARAVETFVRDLGDARISCHLQPTNGGEYGQGRFFLGECEEEFFVILHDDDVMTPEHLDTAVRRLREHPDLACFQSNAFQMDSDRVVSRERTEAYRAARGRTGRPEGPVEILGPLLDTGFFVISGTVFRTAALRGSGFVDDDFSGMYPFELNVLLRLGERAERGYFATDDLVGYRFHAGQMQAYMAIHSNPEVLARMITLLERRRFSGACERRRRVLIAIMHIFRAAAAASSGDRAACRREYVRALSQKPLSWRSWLLCPFVFVLPSLLPGIVHYVAVRSGSLKA